MVIKDQNNFYSGVLFMAIGIGTVVLSLGYRIGTPARMGSGFFPLSLGIILVGLGIVLAVQSCMSGSAEDRLERWELRPLLVVLASVFVFGFLLTDFGLLLAIVAMVVVSSFAGSGTRWVTVLSTAVVLAGFCYLVFVVGLELQVPVLPRFD